jgi:hypothetical protein
MKLSVDASQCTAHGRCSARRRRRGGGTCHEGAISLIP